MNQQNDLKEILKKTNHFKTIDLNQIFNETVIKTENFSFIYFETREIWPGLFSDQNEKDPNSKRYYKIVFDNYFIEKYYQDSNILDFKKDPSYDITKLQNEFKAYLNHLLKRLS